jgi:hypothetical protein
VAAVGGLFGAVAHDPVPRFEAELAARGLGEAPLGAETGRLQDRLRFDLRRTVVRVPDARAAVAWLSDSPPRAALLRRETWEGIAADLPPGREAIAEGWQLPRVSWRWLVDRGIGAALRERKEELVLVAAPSPSPPR